MDVFKFVAYVFLLQIENIIIQSLTLTWGICNGDDGKVPICLFYLSSRCNSIICSRFTDSLNAEL